jgi:hypothetical protein
MIEERETFSPRVSIGGMWGHSTMIRKPPETAVAVQLACWRIRAAEWRIFSPILQMGGSVVTGSPV